MFTANALRHQHLHRFSEQLGSAVFEKRFRLGIDENDFSPFVDDDDGVGRRLQQSTELGFGFFPLGDVADRAHGKGALFGFQGTQTDFDRKLGAVFPAGEKLQTWAHGASLGLSEVVCSVGHVTLSEPFRKEDFNRFAP